LAQIAIRNSTYGGNQRNKSRNGDVKVPAQRTPQTGWRYPANLTLRDVTGKANDCHQPCRNPSAEVFRQKSRPRGRLDEAKQL